jgi:hypothetical protein
MTHLDNEIVMENKQTQPYEGFAAMENLMDKLKLLNFEGDSSSGLGSNHIHRLFIIMIIVPDHYLNTSHV